MSKKSKLVYRPPEFSAPAAYVRASQSRRASGAAGVHGDRRNRRVRDRGAAERRAIHELRTR